MSKNKGKVQEAEPEPEPVQNDPVIETGKGEFLFPNGARYLGEWKSVNGIKFRHGEGEYQYGPEVYSGQWSDDKMCGAGKQTFSSGAYYDGEFKDNMFEGNGIYRFPEGATYRYHAEYIKRWTCKTIKLNFIIQRLVALQ